MHIDHLTLFGHIFDFVCLAGLYGKHRAMCKLTLFTVDDKDYSAPHYVEDFIKVSVAVQRGTASSRKHYVA